MGGWGEWVRSWPLLQVEVAEGTVRSLGLDQCFGNRVLLSQEEKTLLTPATSMSLYLDVNQLMRIRAGG